MNDAVSQAPQYCSDLVRGRDEDRWLAAGYASPPLRRSLMALYAFHVELRRVPSMVSEPPLGEIRLQWWRDAFSEVREGKPPRAHPVVEEIAVAGLAGPEFEILIEESVDANARLLYGEPFSTIEELEQWFDQAEGAIDAGAALLAGGDQSIQMAARRAGAGFAMAREGRALAPSLAGETQTRCLEIAKETAANLKAAPASVAPAVLHLALTNAYIGRSEQPFPIVKRLRLFSAMAFGRF